MAYPTIYQTPVNTGILPGGGTGVELANMTRRAVVPVIFVQIYQSHPAWSYFMQGAQTARGGAPQIVFLTQGTSFTSFSWGSFAGDFPMPTNADAIQNAMFNLKLGMVPIGFYGMESIVQSSEVIIPRLRAVTSDASVVMKQALAQSLYANNFANPLALDSLSMAYDSGANAPTYGGIPRAGNQFWQGQYIQARPNAMSAIGMAQLQVQVQTGAGGEAPSFGICSPADWANLLGDFMQREMYQSTPRSKYGENDVVNAGFRAIRVLDTPIFSDPFCPVGTMYFVNTRYMTAFLHEQAAFVFSDFQSLISQGQIASIGVFITLLDLACAKPSSGAQIFNLQGAAWTNTPTSFPAVI